MGLGIPEDFGCRPGVMTTYSVILFSFLLSPTKLGVFGKIRILEPASLHFFGSSNKKPVVSLNLFKTNKRPVFFFLLAEIRME